jgi:putative membrane protein
MSIRLTRSIAVLGACALFAACAKKDNTADSTAAADSAARANASATPTATATAAPLSDANIAALLDEANAGDSTNGNLASTKGTAASVKDFGKMMMRDHHALRKQGQDLAKKLNLTPQPPAGDTLPAAGKKMNDSLKAQAKGAAWDQAYISSEVAVHQSVLSLLQAAQGAAQDTSLKALITKAIPNIQAHLAKAQDIQSKLGSGGAAGAATPAAGASMDTAAKKSKKP